MNFKYYIDKEQRIVIRRYQGDITLVNLEKSLEIVWADPDYDSSYHGITDFRDSKLLFSRDTLYQIIKKVAESPMSLRGKIALLVSEPLSAAMATIYGEEMKNMNDVEIFCYTIEATQFLNVKENIFECLNDKELIFVE